MGLNLRDLDPEIGELLRLVRDHSDASKIHVQFQITLRSIDSKIKVAIQEKRTWAGVGKDTSWYDKVLLTLGKIKEAIELVERDSHNALQHIETAASLLKEIIMR